MVSEQLLLPAQTKYLHEIAFTTLEEKNFADVMKQAFDVLDLDTKGNPWSGDLTQVDLGKLRDIVNQLRAM